MASRKRKVLWAPWRLDYILGEKEEGCIFCNRITRKNDAADLILARGEKVFVIMNRYPYNNGHLMVVPFRHVGDLTALDADEAAELMYWLQQSVRALEKALQPQGFNIGLNLGKVAGAGVDNHVHFHIVPRWESDTNFMPVISNMRVVPEALAETYEKLNSAFASLTP